MGESRAPRLARKLVLGTEPLCGARLGFGGFLFTIFGRGAGLERAEEAVGGIGDFVNGGIERCLIRLRGLIEPADLPDKLQRSRANFFLCDRRIEIKQYPDVSAHEPTPKIVVTRT